MLIGFNAFKNTAYRYVFGFMQKLDYKPGKDRISLFVNIANIDFNVLILMAMLGVALVFLFYLQFGHFSAGI